MKDAEKELREVIAYLDQARALMQALTEIKRAFELGEAVEVAFRSTRTTAVALSLKGEGKDLAYSLANQAMLRVIELERQEVYWCGEVAFEAKQKQIDIALRLNQDKTFREVADSIEKEGCAGE
ncbi:hypothetical protein [Hymenobacter guriensis]|uniref:Uncharacterized protein n=1 Tax=Hymenobacter guriensis TaxID=2793065 RepID=A0ABS0L7M4_9BACT|nr:hypothetical protein [Hymenobacter guriensis]MBG8556150.1 hypothetical protein [Hymenobacter guriensis]